MELQQPLQGNITGGVPIQGAWTGQLKFVQLAHRYTGGKLADMPMYNKASDIDPKSNLKGKRTIVQAFTR